MHLTFKTLKPIHTVTQLTYAQNHTQIYTLKLTPTQLYYVYTYTHTLIYIYIKYQHTHILLNTLWDRLYILNNIIYLPIEIWVTFFF